MADYRLKLHMHCKGTSMSPSLRLHVFLWLALGSALIASPSHGQNPATRSVQSYPSKPIRLIVPFAPGGGNDLLARIVSQKFQESWGQPVLVENKPGAGGNIGADFVAKSAPDGHTLLLGTNTLTMNPSIFRQMPFDTEQDFAPVAMLATTPLMVLVNPTLPVNSIPELIAYARNHPGALSYATPGIGTPHHLGTELFKTMSGTYMVHIAYRGSALALADLVSGQVQVMWATVNVALPLVKSGKLRGLAVAEPRRLPSLPDMPVVAEALPGYEVSAWYAVFAPAATPGEIVQQLSIELLRIYQLPDVKERLLPLGYEIATGSAEQLRSIVRSDLRKWAKLVKDAGIKPE
jgi:tripartite-type tricarboxylate transporter receptor subunit TctC